MSVFSQFSVASLSDLPKHLIDLLKLRDDCPNICFIGGPFHKPAELALHRLHLGGVIGCSAGQALAAMICQLLNGTREVFVGRCE